jgi:subtilase family serine protease
MSRKRKILIGILLNVVLLSSALPSAIFAQEPTMKMSGNHIDQRVVSENLSSLPKVDPNAIVTLRVAFAMQQEFHDRVEGLYDPKSPYYHQFLKTGEWKRFVVREEDFAEVARWLRGEGFEVVSESKGEINSTITFSGKASTIETVFQARIANFGGYYFLDDPSIPTRFAKIIAGFLSNTPPPPPVPVVEDRAF